MKCLHCGATAPNQVSVCPECGRKMWRPRLAWRRCEHCGGLVHVSRTFCGACGRPLTRQRLTPWLVGLLAAIALGVIALVNRQSLGHFIAQQLAPLPAALGAAARPVLATVTLAPLGQPLPSVTSAAALAATTTPTKRLSLPTGTAPPAPPTSAPTSMASASALLPAPVLLAPADGFTFAGGDTEIWLRWEPVDGLGEDDYYAISLRYQKGEVTVYSSTWYQGTEWLVPRDVWQENDPVRPVYEWDVVVMRQTGIREDGGRLGEAVGAVSETRRFVWR